MTCREAYEKQFPEEKRTPDNWHVWKLAWNQAVEQATRLITDIYIF